MIECLLVGTGGFVGSVLRYLLGRLPVRTESGFPVITLLINVTGAFLLGLIAAAAAKSRLSPHLVLLLQVGLCGGFTTFSAFSYETVRLFENGRPLIAVGYVLSSALLGILAVLAAQFLMRT